MITDNCFRAMRRFFIEDIKEDSKEVRIYGPEFTHLKKVLRLAVGDPLSVFDGRGLELSGRVVSIGRAGALVSIDSRVEGGAESPTKVILLQGLLKGAKPGFVVQKATELGVSSLCFYGGGRAVPGIQGDRVAGRIKKWRRVAIEAAKQCGRSVVPGVEYSADLDGAIQALGPLDGWCKLRGDAGEAAPSISIKEALSRPAKEGGVVLLVGPEGGFSDRELDLADRAGFIPVGLGPRTLRAETAAIAILSIVQYELGP
jgi:16S rRNA (uracil1498-N3)-methyltransferase